MNKVGRNTNVHTVHSLQVKTVFRSRLLPPLLPQPGGGSHPRGSTHRGDGHLGPRSDEDGQEEGNYQEAAHRGDTW